MDKAHKQVICFNDLEREHYYTLEPSEITVNEGKLCDNNVGKLFVSLWPLCYFYKNNTVTNDLLLNYLSHRAAHSKVLL